MNNDYDEQVNTAIEKKKKEFLRKLTRKVERL